jgi:putative tryptophan/tyrosine transport system substrate-binding protein
MTTRREFIALLGGAAATWPQAAWAQQTAIPVVGFVHRESAEQSQALLRAFRQGLSEAGFVEGRSVLIQYRWGEGQAERLPALVAELVARPVAVIVAGADSAALAAKRATATIPIVFSAGSDPVKQGLVASLHRPGGNLTGVTNLNIELGPKRLQMLRELVPSKTRVAALINPTNPSVEIITRDLQSAARNFGLELQILHASNDGQIDQAFETLARSQPGALAVGADSYYMARSEKLAALVVRNALPAIFQTRQFTAAGGLASYGSSVADAYRQVGVLTGRVLKGEKPGDLPVQQATKVELFINLKSAKALGLSVPLPLLGRADEVIE